jgi:Cu+-exporting ATPase
MQGIGKGKTSQSIVKLMDLQPTSATLVESGESEVPIELLKKGDIVKVLPGDKIPVDGIVTQGSSSVDESMITGESLPVTKQVNDKIISGSINIDGVLYIKAIGIGASSTLVGIAKLIEDAQLKKPKIQVYNSSSC